MRFLARLWMTPAQRSLKDPAAFDAPQDRAALVRAIASDSGYCHERRDWMTRSANEIGSGPTLTIREVERSAESSAFSRDNNRERAFHNAAIGFALGDDGLLRLMIGRANQIADGIQPGAKAMFSDAF